MRCLRCGYRLSAFEDECPACEGKASAAASWICRTCGAHNPHEVRACVECGAPFSHRAVLMGTKLATFSRRLIAQLIDGIVVLLAVGGLTLLGNMFSPEWGLEGGQQLGLTVDQFVLAASIILGVAYQTTLIAVWGATVGKLALGMQVVRTSGSRVGWWEALLRAVALVASLVTLGLVFLLIARDRTKQGLHDKLVDTMVIRV